MLSKNIVIEKELLDDADDSLLKLLNFVSLNLDDFNKRLDCNIKIKITSSAGNFSFLNTSCQYSKLFDRYLSFLLLQRGKNNVDEFIQSSKGYIEVAFDFINSSILKHKGSFSTNSIEYSKYILFVKRYSNYSPLGILSKEQQTEFSAYTQRFVETLNSNFTKYN